jgi:hypothetical protein
MLQAYRKLIDMKVAQYNKYLNQYWNYRDMEWVGDINDATHIDFEHVCLHYTLLEPPLMWQKVPDAGLATTPPNP